MTHKMWRGRDIGLGIDGPVLTASLTLNILSLLTPLVILLIFDRVIPYESFQTLTILTLVLCIAAGTELVLRWARSTMLNMAAARAAVTNHMNFLDCVVSANVRRFAKSPPAVHLERHSAVARLRDHYSGQNQALAIDVPFTAMFIIMVALIGGWLVLVPLGCLLTVLIFAFSMKRAQASIFDTRKSLDERRYAFLSEVLSKIVTVKSNTMERQMTRRFELLQDQTVTTSRRLILFTGLAQSFGSLISQLSIAAVGLFGSYLVILGLIGIAELAACMMLNGRIIQPLTRLVTLWVQAESIAVSRRKLGKMDSLKDHSDKSRPAQKMRGSIVFRNTVLSSTTDTVPVSATIEAGTTVLVDTALDWAMPALVDAITGQIAPKGGSILIDGLMAADRISERGPSALVVLERSPAIFSGTVLDNISAFGDAQQIERAKHFAKLLGLERRIFRLPAGYLTQLNNNVFEKDHANRQLIALVRAIAMQPKILLMNEPTSVLETPEREALSACLASLSPRPTILISSPDPRMKRLAEKRLALVSAHDAANAAWIADVDADAPAKHNFQRGAA
ncbi:ABC transporter transmembrane domain-containing protein [Aliiroseovarius sp. 2305UL8-7]|uniref:ABC transporter transmembrane domain-containing protein n=1 Tax=Aliiroseovarius conchicola TaxID=3121637 RepID=UPI0035286EBF